MLIHEAAPLECDMLGTYGKSKQWIMCITQLTLTVFQVLSLSKNHC